MIRRLSATNMYKIVIRKGLRLMEISSPNIAPEFIDHHLLSKVIRVLQISQLFAKRWQRPKFGAKDCIMKHPIPFLSRS